MATKKSFSKKAERRENPRVPVNIWVREERSDYYFLFKATDISQGGLFLEKKIDNPGRGIRSTFKFTLPKSSRLITAHGEVVFTNTSRDDKISGSGIRFDKVSNQDRKLILKFIRQST